MASAYLSPSRRIMYEELRLNAGKRYPRVCPDTERLAELHGLSVETLAQSLVELASQGRISKERSGRKVFYFLTDEQANGPERAPSATRCFTVVYERGEDDYVIASVPALPGCYSQGRTKEEAKRNIREATRGYIASLQHRGERVPEEVDSEQIEVAV